MLAVWWLFGAASVAEYLLAMRLLLPANTLPAATHNESVCLAAACLSIRHDRAVVTVEHGCYNVPASVKHVALALLLSCTAQHSTAQHSTHSMSSTAASDNKRQLGRQIDPACSLRC
jgi:hypothetical protein